MIPLRNWATPLIIGASILLAVTGVLMFFHLDSGLNKTAHEWLSWLFIAGMAGHVIANLPSLKRHLTAPLGRGIVVVFVLLLAGSFMSFGGGKGKPPMRLIAQSVAAAPLASVAGVAGTSVEDLVRKLQRGGYDKAEASVSVRQLADGNQGEENRIMSLIFAK